MRVKRCHTRLLVLLYVAVKARGFSNPPLPSQLLTRGGDDNLQDEEIDQYIEDLIATVDSLSESSSEDIRDDIEIKVDTEQVDQEGHHETKMDGVDVDASDNVEDEDDMSDAPSVETIKKEKSTEEMEESNSDELKIPSRVKDDDEPDDQEATSDSNEIAKRTKRRKKRNASGDKETRDGQADDGEGESESEEKAAALPERAVGPTRPNALYRFLLNQGRIGHIVVLICVLIAELIMTYIPPLARLLAFIFSFILPSDRMEGGGSFRRGPRGPVQKVNEQYAAFVSSDGSSVRGKQRKKQARKADEQAVEKLRRVGSIQDAKFRHVSQDFMHRHGIGSFRDSEKSHDVVVYKERGAMTKSAGGDEEESDVDWVVEALSAEQEEEEATNPIETSFGVGLGSDGATISVGVQFGSSKKIRKKKRQSSLAEAAFERTPVPKKKPAGPRTSDRDGGGGVIGRIRAAGANSRMSRSLLGAYPGDAVPLSEAGNANGVTALAEKYGYGDWSDDEESDDDFEVGSPRRKMKKIRSSKKRKAGKPSSSSGVSFQFGLSSSSESSRRTTPKRPASIIRRNEDSAKTSVPSTKRSEILPSRATGSLPERKRVEVRPPMEKLNFATEKAKRRRDED